VRRRFLGGRPDQPVLECLPWRASLQLLSRSQSAQVQWSEKRAATAVTDQPSSRKAAQQDEQSRAVLPARDRGRGLLRSAQRSTLSVVDQLGRQRVRTLDRVDRRSRGLSPGRRTDQLARSRSNAYGPRARIPKERPSDSAA